jgi:hypothetical protein
MKRPRLLIGILAGLHIVLAALVLWRYAFIEAFHRRPTDLLDMLLLSQSNLLGFWTALGGKRTPWRVTLTVVGIVVCLAACDWSGYYDLRSGAVLVFVWQTINVSVLLLLARMMGLKLIQTGSERVEQELGRFQFSLWQMLSWTTVFAIVLSALHYLPYNLQPDFRFNPIVARIAVSCGSVALASMWVALGRRWLIARVVLLVATIGSGAAVLWYSAGARFETWAYFCLLLLIQAAWTTGWLLVVRWAGYELTWR